MSPDALRRKQELVYSVRDLSARPVRVLGLTAAVFVSIEVALIVFHFAVLKWLSASGFQTEDGHIGGFDLGDEATLAVWFSSFQLLLLSVAALALSWIDRIDSKQSSTVILWKFAAVVFAIMSIDETSGLHEIFGKGMEHVLPAVALTDRMWGMLPYVMSLAVVLVFAVIRMSVNFKFVIGVALAGGCWLSGQIVDQLQLFSGEVGVAIEEGTEMFGSTVLLVTMASFMLRLMSTRKRL